MNLKTKFTTIAAASIFALGMGTTAFATESTVTQEITKGLISAYLADGSIMTSVKFSNADQPTTGVLKVQVNDARGTDEGWSVTIQSTSGFVDIIDDPEGETIPASGFEITGYTGNPVALPGTASDAAAGTATGVLTTAHTVMTAADGGGTGIFTQDVNVGLTIPAQTAVGTYVATVTVLTADAPI